MHKLVFPQLNAGFIPEVPEHESDMDKLKFKYLESRQGACAYQAGVARKM